MVTPPLPACPQPAVILKSGELVQRSSATLFNSGRSLPSVTPDIGVSVSSRSEERRVEKECRSRWSPHHSKKSTRTKGVGAAEGAGVGLRLSSKKKRTKQ